MTAAPDVHHPLRDEAFQLAIDLASHILENANTYHVLSGADEYKGRERMRFATLIVMLEETGKLFNLVRECEKAAKADYLSVRVEDFHNNCLNGRRALAQILEELRTMEKAFLTLGKGEVGLTMKLDFTKEDFCSLQDRLLYLSMDRSARDMGFIPPGNMMDRLAATIERNALSAGEYIHDLGRSLGLWLTLDLCPRQQEGAPHSLRYA